jgi:F0F1-type ATP synthase membrane subunit b/b'
MAAQFLVLMVVLDKLVYKPVGAVLDSRDAELRTKLESVKDNAGDLLKYTVRAAQRHAHARARVEPPRS